MNRVDGFTYNLDAVEIQRVRVNIHGVDLATSIVSAIFL
jgi:hypothetical protein